MESKRILFVDDDEDYAFQIVHYLKQAGFEVITASSQADGELLIKTAEFDLALLDLMMENDDSGFVLSRRIKMLRPEVPVIIATAVANETGISFYELAESGNDLIKADRYIEKGIRPEALIALINNLLNR